MTGYFKALERELTGAAARTGSRRRRPRRVALLAAALVLAVGVPAIAVNDVFIPRREADGLFRLSEHRAIAQGITSDGQRWRLLASRSDSGFCLGIELRIIAAGRSGDGLAEGCGGSSPGRLSVATASGGSEPQNAVVYGLAPDQAEAVRVRAHGRTVTVATVDDRAGLDGRAYVADLPIRTAIRRTAVEALDGRGRVIATKKLG